MPYDERLADRVRQALAGTPGVSERKMFGGLVFLVDGKMAVGVLNDEIVVRCGPARYGEALRSAHGRPMDFTGRPMTGMVYVARAGITRRPALQRWVEMGLAGARSATPARRRTTRARPANPRRRRSRSEGHR